jgi:hypothetical protein
VAFEQAFAIESLVDPLNHSGSMTGRAGCGQSEPPQPRFVAAEDSLWFHVDSFFKLMLSSRLLIPDEVALKWECIVNGWISECLRRRVDEDSKVSDRRSTVC